MLNDVIQSEIGEEQKPYSRKDIADFVTDFLAKAKQEAAPQNYNQPLGNNLLKDNDLPNGSKHSN